jgi:hypothetical protein
MKPKFFLKISDHQQSMAPRPLRGAILIPPALVVADFAMGVGNGTGANPDTVTGSLSGIE